MAGSTSRQSACGGLDEERELDVVDGERLGVGEEAAVEAQDVAVEDGGEAAGVHRGPEGGEGGGDVLGGAAEVGQEVAKAVLGDQADVLGEHGEEAAHEEAGDAVGGVALRLEGVAEGGEAAGDLAGDAGGGAGGVEGVGVGPDEARGGRGWRGRARSSRRMRKRVASGKWV